jgi:hypothetical protein
MLPAEAHETATTLLRRLLGVPLRTVTGRPNLIIEVQSNEVRVVTDRSQDGQPVPIQDVEIALSTLRQTGSVVIHPDELGYRSSFIGAVLLTLPGASVAGFPQP